MQIEIRIDYSDYLIANCQHRITNHKMIGHHLLLLGQTGGMIYSIFTRSEVVTLLFLDIPVFRYSGIPIFRYVRLLQWLTYHQWCLLLLLLMVFATIAPIAPIAPIARYQSLESNVTTPYCTEYNPVNTLAGNNARRG